MNKKKNFKFSIITPTYNREKLLERLWLSLKLQGEYISEWIVIDDGSNDQTAALVESFKKESGFKIVYEYNKNRGMTYAINAGLKYVRGQYFFKLDSDDYLLENSLEIIYTSIHKIINSTINKKIYAFSFLTSNPKGQIINKYKKLLSMGNIFDEKIITLDYFSARYLNFITGDLLDIFNSYPLINHFRYPVFNDESHVPSSFISYFNADYYEGEVAYVLKNVLVKDYQCDGISSQRKKYGSNVPNKNLKGYLVSFLWLINISSKKIKPFFLVYKNILKIFIIFNFTSLAKFIGLLYFHLEKILKKLLLK